MEAFRGVSVGQRLLPADSTMNSGEPQEKRSFELCVRPSVLSC